MFSKPECSKTPRIFQAILEPFVFLFQPAFTVVKRAFAMYLQKSTMSDEIEALSYRGFNEIPLDNYSRSNFKNSIWTSINLDIRALASSIQMIAVSVTQIQQHRFIWFLSLWLQMKVRNLRTLEGWSVDGSTDDNDVLLGVVYGSSLAATDFFLKYWKR